MILEIEEPTQEVPEVATTQKVPDVATAVKVDEDFVKMSAFAAELESSIRRAESKSGATLGDNRFVISTDNHKWMVYIRRIDDVSSELVTEIIE